MSLFSDEKITVKSPILIDASTQGYAVANQTLYGVTLTAGDLPLIAAQDNAGAWNIVVLTSGNAVAVRS